MPIEVTTGHVVVEMHVSDNGIGMDEEAKARLFTAFTQADSSTTRRFGGTGLGLVISRGLVELMGGSLLVQSASGEGTTFTVRLQFALAAEDAGVVKPASAVAGLSCVVAGGQLGLSDDLAAYLAQDGARVERAADLAAMRSLSLELPPGPWIWVVDVADTSISPKDLASLARTLPEHAIRIVAIGRGPRGAQHEHFAEMPLLDGNVLTRRRLLKEVALAAGRELVEQEAPARGKQEAAFMAPSHDDALRDCRLILVAEDNDINQKVILRQLALLGYAADVVENGRLALERWRGGNYGLVLSDLHMPELDGYELTTAIRSEEQGVSRIPIVALTANALKGEADHCRAVGMDDYLTKPMQLTDLKAALQKWLPTAVLPSRCILGDVSAEVMRSRSRVPGRGVEV